MAVNIYQIFHTIHAPTITAVPAPDKFCAEVLGNLERFPRDAAIPKLQLGDPSMKSQGFFNISDSVLVFSKGVYLSPMGAGLDVAGNVHKTELTDTGEDVFLLNVTACYNCIDRSKTIFYAPNGRDELGVDHGLGVKSPGFFPKLIGDSWIFRLPQMRYAIFVASDGRGTDEDFYTLYKNSGMDELRFDQVWAE